MYTHTHQSTANACDKCEHKMVRCKLPRWSNGEKKIKQVPCSEMNAVQQAAWASDRHCSLQRRDRSVRTICRNNGSGLTCLFGNAPHGFHADPLFELIDSCIPGRTSRPVHYFHSLVASDAHLTHRRGNVERGAFGCRFSPVYSGGLNRTRAE